MDATVEWFYLTSKLPALQAKSCFKNLDLMFDSVCSTFVCYFICFSHFMPFEKLPRKTFVFMACFKLLFRIMLFFIGVSANVYVPMHL